MPAIQPARLKQQAALVAQYFDQPASFLRSLHHLLEFYADRARRPGQSGTLPPLIETYNVRPPVLRLLIQELVPLAEKDPAAGLVLCDALWSQAKLEFRWLAASLLGQIPPQPPGPVLERIQTWLSSRPEERLINAILDLGLQRLRQDNPDHLISVIENWLTQEDLYFTRLGLRALLPLIDDPHHENLPVLFRLIQPLTRRTPPSVRPELLEVIVTLAKRSPRETAFFMRQNLELIGSADTAWMIRQSLKSFPEEIQESLRIAVRSGEWKRVSP
jgi:hypothetical protein